MDALSNVGPGRDLMGRLMEMTEVVQRALRSRQLTRKMAEYYFDTAEHAFLSLRSVGVLAHGEEMTLLPLLREARRSVLYLFDYPDDYKGCFTPSRT
jgi:hypothetical protein